MQPVTISTLKSFETLQNVPDAQLQWLIDESEQRVIKDGESFVKPDQPMSGPHFIIDGHLVAHMIQYGSKRELGVFSKGDITGYLPYSRGKVATVYMSAKGDVQLLSFPTEKVREMIQGQFELTQALVHVMSNRVRDFTALQQQNEKMMALGKLSAGLTHELNNPASAIIRDSDTLKEHLRLEPQNFKKVITVQMNAEQVDAVNDILFQLLSIKDRPRLTLKEKTKLENQTTDWLDEHEIENSDELAETFVEFNLSTDHLDTLTQHIPANYISKVLGWINKLLVTEKLVDDIQESSRRISELVKSVKTFTHMDRGTDKQYADIHTGIRNTLTMLGYRKRKGNITLVEDYDLNLPPVKALIGELNQVWTNLIDNAFDAMEDNGNGTLTIKTERCQNDVHVTITDNGPGIPEDVQSRIFDPFFTTKEMGKGTGMGLEVVQRIVHQHNGSIKVKSEPGHTEFMVCFPING